jgi:uncharacterized protein
MIIVSDTSAITALIQIGRVQILPQLYDTVIIPIEVERELHRFHPVIPEFIRVVPITDHARFESLAVEVDIGEAAAIKLMLEGAGNLLLMDERRGRRIAERERIPVIGVLFEAKFNRLITLLSIVINELEKVNFRLSPQLKAAAQRRAGEN